MGVQSAQGSGCNRFTNRDTLRAPSVLYLTTVYSKSMSSSWKKDSPSNSPPANALASQSQATQQLQFPIKSQSQSNSQSPQEKQQPQAIYPCQWSAHTPPFEQSPLPFSRNAHTLSTSVTSAGELFLFGGAVHRSQSPSNDLYVISTRDFSTTLFKTSGDVPNPRYGHRAVLTSTSLLIWGGMTNFREKAPDDSLYLLNLGTSDLFDVKSYSS
jgi:hypothetical protein